MTKINFSGNVDDVKKQIEQSVATFELLGNRSSINFEEWFENWKSGFAAAIENRALGNYSLSGENAWRSDASKRPRWRQWSNDNGIITGEYWRDFSVETESIPLSGTAEQLVQHIVQIEYEGGRGQQQKSVDSDIVRYSGIPEITLYFKGIDKSNPQVPKVIEGVKSFRFMGYTDNPTTAQKRDDLELIKETDINRIATKIKTIFGTSPAYKWSKGKKLVVYHDWSRGYNLNIYCSNHAEGDRLLAAVLAVRELEVDEAFVKYSQAKNPAKAYPPVSEIEVLGEKHKTNDRFPVVDVTYQYATIHLPTIKETRHIS